MVLFRIFRPLRRGWTLQLVILLLVVGCSAPPPKLHHDWVRLSPNIKVRFTSDFSTIRKLYKNDSIVGLSLLFEDSCTIYIPPIEHVLDDRSMCIAGHELMHCIFGQFHSPEMGYSCSQ